MCGFELDAIAQVVAVTRSWIFGVSPIISLTSCHVFRCRVFRVPNASLLRGISCGCCTSASMFVMHPGAHSLPWVVSMKATNQTS
ncbi:unnamed protein product [Ectocarpus sp. CCAP 1310/34]|nr:unnamed protein product [Ectocarpus sp. CCAP 1310/34]